LLDERLTPLERNAWLTFRALASNNGTVVLSYDALRKYLPRHRAASERPLKPCPGPCCACGCPRGLRWSSTAAIR
jgi:hypothetical protein